MIYIVCGNVGTRRIFWNNVGTRRINKEINGSPQLKNFLTQITTNTIFELCILKTLEMLEEKCKYICHLNLKLVNEPKVTTEIKKEAVEISDKNLKKLKENLYILTINRSKFQVNTDTL
ncbi:hypothetical protein BpHYR1_006162 [Brachionus plicatilis]|uniref:Uncharacterized protein n=1 Tax=Brachionus plicatilis TaxID=10195 RepID=A0A3M7PRK3_BRAPC|nr:hypothetical protein BpHYR1_006162 [Brachionus plicatilis]